MKLNFKDLKQQKFSVEAEESETVADVKQKVAAEKGFDAAQMRLIWSGKILADANTIGSYEIKQTDQIVCMIQKPKAAPAAPKEPTTPAPATAQTPSAPAPAAAAPGLARTEPANAPATPSPAPAMTASAQPTDPSQANQDTSGMMMGAERQAAIAHMESMGFERPQIERAMRAAYFNADRAVEYLLNGIPENVPAAQPAQAPAATASAVPQVAPPAQPATAAQQVPPAEAEADEPVNLFEAAAAAQGNRGGARGAAGAPAGATAATGAATGGAGAAPAGAGTNLDFLRENPTFRHLRQLVQQQPQMLENVLQTVGASNPQLAELISQHPDQFIQLLAEGGGEEGEGGPQLPPGIQNVSVTTEERDAIERLCRLGFERDLVIQIYFACDKNEELAANWLFDNPDEEGDQQ